jgi:hypothetical protein
MKCILNYLSYYILLFIFFQIIFPLFVSYKKTGIKAGTIGYYPIAIIVMCVLLFFIEGSLTCKIVFFLIIIGAEVVYYFLILSPLTRLLDLILVRFISKMINRGLFK